MFPPDVTRRTVLAGGATAASAVFIASCSPRPATSTLETVRLRQEWFPYSGFAGEVLAAARYARNVGVDLQVRAGGETIDPIKNVLANQDDMGVVSGDLLIKAVAAGAPLVAIGVVNDISPTCFIAKAQSGIRTVQDFVGKRVGVLRGTNTERIYELLMLRNHLSRTLVREVDAPFELNTFILGQYDVRPAFIYDEPVTLARDKIPINIIKPSDYGVSVIGTVYFTRQDVIASRRDALVRTLGALVKGWRDVATPEGRTAAIAELKKRFPEVDAAREAESLRLGAPLFLGPTGSGKPLTVMPEHLTNTAEGLAQLGDIRAPVAVSRFWNGDLLKDAYRSLGG